MDKRTNVNMIFSLLLQMVTIISGFIIPREILNAFGSQVNGLVSSITQFLNYISLVEGGVGSVLMALFYSPLSTRDKHGISEIVVAGNKFFRKIAKIFLIYLVFLAFLYPFFIDSGFNYGYVSSLTLILGIALFIQYYFSIIWKLMLQADGRVYVSSSIQIIVVVLNTVLTVVFIRLYPSIHIVKLIASAAYIIQPIAYEYYLKKHYDLDLSVKADPDLLEHRWDGFGINLAAFLNGNTDVIVLSFLSTLSNVSIYGIYNLVAMGLKSIITSISAGITPSLGKLYALGHKDELNSLLNKYENLIFYITFSAYSCAILLIVPFVMVYTTGIYDANYNQPVFSCLLLLSAAVFCLREPYVNMAYVGNAFKPVSKFAYIEVIINVVLSVIFVYSFGLNGVAMGTLVSMTVRTIYQVIFLKKNIVQRSPLLFILKGLMYVLTSCCGMLIAIKVVSYGDIASWGRWVFKAIMTALIIFGLNICGVIGAFKLDKRYIGKKCEVELN